MKKKIKIEKIINYSRQDIISEDIEAVCKVMHSDFLTQGDEVPLFESELSSKVNAKYAVAVNSGTSALHLACMALDIGEGDIAWTSANTFVASANCARYCGAEIDFVDICPESWNLSIDELEKKLINAKKYKKLPKVLIAVHFAGLPTDQERIHHLSIKYGFKIIEDASHSLGASYNGEAVGSCKWSDVTVFSFHPVKPITSGEGGMAVTNNSKLYRSMKRLRTHGIEYDKELFLNKKQSSWNYEQQQLGFNYRMTDIHAALGRSQLKRIKQYTRIRNDLAARYFSLLKDLPLNLPKKYENKYSAYHLFVVILDLGEIASTHEEVFNNLRKKKIGVNLHYTPVHLHPYYKNQGFKEGDFAEAEKYANSAISIPLHPRLDSSQQDYVVESLYEVLK